MSAGARRILIAGISTHWGGRLAQRFERDPDVETIIGVDERPPGVELQRTEFVECHDAHPLIRRVIRVAEIDTVIDTRLKVDSITTPARLAHETNVVGTVNVLAACAGSDSPVRKVVFKSSAHYYGCHEDDPAFFTETMRAGGTPASRTPIEAAVVGAEAAVLEFAIANPEITVTVLRFAETIGCGINTSQTAVLAKPVLPAILGFDPRMQFIDEEDTAACFEHAVRHDLPGPFNCAADGVLALSEIAGLLGKPLAPLLPPVGTSLAARSLRRMGLPVSRELLAQLRFGRGLDNRRFKTTGYRYRFTTRESVIRLARHPAAV
jgi:UDP-glucose 4-epimerase